MKGAPFLVVLFLAGPAIAQEKALVVVPFETIKSRHMIVDVIVNGKGPFTLIFDTGAPATLIGPILAKEAKIPAGGPWAVLFGKPEHPQIKTFAMGDLKLEKVDVA